MLSLPQRASGTCFKTSKILSIALSARNLSSSSTLVNLKLASSNERKFLQIRCISSKDVFGVLNVMDIPPVPAPAPPMPTIEELAASGESVLDELGLISWWKPSSWIRIGLEGIHNYFDLPWWGAIVAATIGLRLLFVFVPIMSQRLMAKQSHFKPELDSFKNRMTDARAEGDNQKMQMLLIEQRDFLKEKDIKLGRQLGVLAMNGSIFMAQFFAIKRMIGVNYPGWTEGGALWFTDLVACDPYYLLPIVSAATLCAIMKLGVETGASADQMPPTMKLAMLYALPVVVLVSSSQFGAGLCVYWTTSNLISLFYAGLFRIPAIRKLLRIPDVKIWPKSADAPSAWQQALNDYKSKKNAAPSISSIRQKDAELFKKAGRAKPILK